MYIFVSSDASISERRNNRRNDWTHWWLASKKGITLDPPCVDPPLVDKVTLNKGSIHFIQINICSTTIPKKQIG